jgi:geranylgeranyl reductase family protein
MHDVIVSGGGPAGATAAYECATRGLDTVLLEKGAIPRKKCCAGGFLRRGIISLPFELPSSVIQKEIRGFTIDLQDYRKEFDFSKSAGIVLSRDSFDAFLIRKAESVGAKVLEDTKVLGVQETSEKVRIKSTRGQVEGKLLIVAEGAVSTTANSLLGPYPRTTTAIGRAVNVRTERDSGDRIEIHLFGTPTRRLRLKKDFPLNGWMFPHRDGANIGVVGMGVNKDGLDSTLSTMRKKVASRCGLLEGEEDLGAHNLPFYPRNVLHSRRSMMVGDSAGLVNPITGEGLSYALASGRLAARTATEAIKGGMGLKHLSTYDSRCADSIVRDIKVAALLSPLLHRMVGVVDTRRFFDSFHEEKALVQICLGIARGEDDWRSLLLQTIPRFPRLFFASLGNQKRAR